MSITDTSIRPHGRLIARRFWPSPDELRGHVAILAVASAVEGQGIGRALLKAAEEWGRKEGFRRLTLTVFATNQRAKEFSPRQGWQVELETHYKKLS